jgi:predicted MFS family arabinose efflux permease
MQGAAWGGRALGAALGGTVFALSAANYGWTVTVLFIGLLSVVECLSGLVMKEPKLTEERLASIDAFKRVAKKRDTWLGAIYMFIAFASLGSFGLAGSFYMMKGGIDSTMLGYVLTVQNIGAFFGCIAMGRLSDKTGTKKASYIGNALLFASCFLFLTIAPGNTTWLFAVAFTIGALQNAMITALLRVIMELSPPEIGGAMFATYASICNAGSAILGAQLIAYSTSIFGMTNAMVSVAPFVFVASLALPYMKLYVPEKEVEVGAKP